MRGTGGELGSCSSGRNMHLGRSTEKNNSPYTSTGSLCMVIVEEISEHGKGCLKDGGHSRVKEGLSHFLSSFLPLGSLADFVKGTTTHVRAPESLPLWHHRRDGLWDHNVQGRRRWLLREALAGAMAPYKAGKQTHLSSLDNTVKPTWDSTPAGHEFVSTDHPEAIPKMHSTIPLQFY